MFNPETITKITRYLRNADVGMYVTNGTRKVVVTNMAGGRYLFYDGNYVSGQADQEHYAIRFLKTGDCIKEKYAGDAVVR